MSASGASDPHQGPLPPESDPKITFYPHKGPGSPLHDTQTHTQINIQHEIMSYNSIM